MAFPKAFITCSSLVGAAMVKATVSASMVVVLMFVVSRMRAGQGGSIALRANGLSLMLWSITFCIDSSISSSMSGRLFPFPLLVLLCSS